MIKKALLIITIILLINTTTFSNSNFLTRDVPRTDTGYQALDWFIIENRTPEILSYNRSTTLSSYRFTMMLVEIIDKIKDFPKPIPENILNILEDLIPQFSNEINFLYGDIIKKLKDDINDHRKKTGRIKRKTKILKRKKLGVYDKPRQIFKTDSSSLSSSYTWMLQNEVWEKGKQKEEYNNMHIRLFSNFKLKDTPIISSYYSNDLFSDFNTNIVPANRLTKKSRISYSRYEDEQTGKDSFSVLQTSTKYSKKLFQSINTQLTFKNTKRFNDDSNSYYFTGYKSLILGLKLYDMDDVNYDSSLLLEAEKRDIDNFLAKTEKKTRITANFSKTIYGKFFNNLKITNKFSNLLIDTNDVKDYSGDLKNNILSLFLPLENTVYSLELTTSKYTADKETYLDYSYDRNKLTVTRIWDNIEFFDIFLHLSFEDFTPTNKSNATWINNDFRKKFLNLSTTRYFNNNSNLSIDITTGEKSFWQEDLIYSNFRFFKRDIDLHIKNYTLSYSALDKRFDLAGRDPKTVQYDIGVYYAKNW